MSFNRMGWVIVFGGAGGGLSGWVLDPGLSTPVKQGGAS